MIAEMKSRKNEIFQEMAIINPFLYQFVYEMYQLPEADKDMMLGVAIGAYHALESQLEKTGLQVLDEEDDESI